MTIETICTIKSALNTLRNMHEYVLRNNKNPEIRECALKGIKRVDSAISEFEEILSVVYGRPYFIGDKNG